VAVHDEVLTAARKICRARRGWTFRLIEVVRSLPHLNERSVRTHVVSRCCVNAPRHHPHRWDYFRRAGRGVYEIRPKYRESPEPARQRQPTRASSAVRERAASYGSEGRPAVRDTIHAAVTRSANLYVAECLEVAVVTQGRTLDELVKNLREAISLHLEGEDPKQFGLVPRPRLAIAYELSAADVAQA
jgi:predicted RNase H-like HicB family nuclease